MGPKTTELVSLLDSVTALLRSCGEEHWASCLEKDVARMRASDFGGIEHFLAAFGGMGSISDLVLHPINGHRLAESEIAPVNERVRALVSRTWELAKQVRNEAVLQ
jgi:hypothetical protein